MIKTIKKGADSLILPGILLSLIIASPSYANSYLLRASALGMINKPAIEKIPDPALHANGVTITCPRSPDGTVFNIKGKNYRVVYSKADAITYAATACTSNVTDMFAMFKENRSFNENIAHWDTSNVTTMQDMFWSATSFNQNISYWDTSSVETMSLMFAIATSFNQPIGNWNLSNVKSIRKMFVNSGVFNHDIGNWDTGKVTDMEGIFIGAKYFNHDISRWNTKSVINMKDLFHGATAFNKNLSQWCVSNIKSKPAGFDQSATKYTQARPVWGTCPRGEINK